MKTQGWKTATSGKLEDYFLQTEHASKKDTKSIWFQNRERQEYTVWLTVKKFDTSIQERKRSP